MASLGPLGAISFFRLFQIHSNFRNSSSSSTICKINSAFLPCINLIPSIPKTKIPIPKQLMEIGIKKVITKNNLYWATFCLDGTTFLSNAPIGEEIMTGTKIFRLLTDGTLIPNYFYESTIRKAPFLRVTRQRAVYICYNCDFSSDWSSKNGSFVKNGVYTGEVIEYHPTEQLNLKYMMTFESFKESHTNPINLPNVLLKLIQSYIFNI